jgi:hypothetical protein
MSLTLDQLYLQSSGRAVIHVERHSRQGASDAAPQIDPERPSVSHLAASICRPDNRVESSASAEATVSVPETAFDIASRMREQTLREHSISHFLIQNQLSVAHIRGQKALDRELLNKVCEWVAQALPLFFASPLGLTQTVFPRYYFASGM